jgi:hypothetical protein
MPSGGLCGTWAVRRRTSRPTRQRPAMRTVPWSEDVCVHDESGEWNRHPRSERACGVPGWFWCRRRSKVRLERMRGLSTAQHRGRHQGRHCTMVQSSRSITTLETSDRAGGVLGRFGETAVSAALEGPWPIWVCLLASAVSRLTSFSARQRPKFRAVMAVVKFLIDDVTATATASRRFDIATELLQQLLHRAL